MGAVGGILYLGVTAVLYPTAKTKGLDHVNYQPLFLVVSGIMIVSVAVLLLTIKEPKLAKENRELEKKHPEWNLAKDDGTGHETLPAPVKKSLAFLLASIALWFVGYNGVTTWFSTYVAEVMGEGVGGTATCLMVATAGAIVSYIPIGTWPPSGAEEDHSVRRGTAGGVLRGGVLSHYRGPVHHAAHVCGLCPGRAGLGGHQRQFSAHGGGDVPGQ